MGIWVYFRLVERRITGFDFSCFVPFVLLSVDYRGRQAKRLLPAGVGYNERAHVPPFSFTFSGSLVLCFFKW